MYLYIYLCINLFNYFSTLLSLSAQLHPRAAIPMTVQYILENHRKAEKSKQLAITCVSALSTKWSLNNTEDCSFHFMQYHSNLSYDKGVISFQRALPSPQEKPFALKN